jgi:hypothetical protein
MVLYIGMPQWSVSSSGKEVVVPKDSQLKLVFTSPQDMIEFISTVILPVAHQFGYDVTVRPVGLPTVRPGV